jgi:hypothetical protein
MGTMGGCTGAQAHGIIQGNAIRKNLIQIADSCTSFSKDVKI